MDNITLSTPHNKALYTSPSPSSSDHHHHHHNHHPYHHYLMSNQSPNLALNLNDDDDGGDGTEHEEPMFEKPLTPSDVGKLNRLVIPKQHAEKYFPLGGSSGGDSAAEKGLLLSFEDEAGKTWRFRYSYWNSSQSYVLTKGWSRYVKEKRLDAGDVVLFKRHRADAERLFIGWRRRASTVPGQDGRLPGAYPAHRGHAAAGHYRNNGLGAGVAPYQPDCIHAGMVSPAQSQTTSLGNSNNSTNTSSKILRLFGVNMECPYHHEHASVEEVSAPDGAGHAHRFYHSANHFSETQYHDHMDFSFAGDVNPMTMRDRRG